MKPGSAPCLGIDPGFEDEEEEDCDHPYTVEIGPDAGTYTTVRCVDCGEEFEEMTG